MLSELGLRNFKAFGKTGQTAPMSRITFIYGPNSGGKSSIIQALLLLKQSLDADRATDRRELMPRGEYVDLGSFSALLYGHDTSEKLEIHVAFKRPFSAPDRSDRSSARSVHMTFGPKSAEPNGAKDALPYLSAVRYQILDAVQSKDTGTRVLLDAELTHDSSGWTARNFAIAQQQGHGIITPSVSVNSFLPALELPGESTLKSAAHRTAKKSATTVIDEPASRLGRQLGSDLARLLTDTIQWFFRAKNISGFRKYRRHEPTARTGRAEKSLVPFLADIQIKSGPKLGDPLKVGLAEGLRVRLEPQRGSNTNVQNLAWRLMLQLADELSPKSRPMRSNAERPAELEKLVANTDLERELQDSLAEVLVRVNGQSWVKDQVEELEAAYTMITKIKNLDLAQIMELTPADIPRTYEDILRSVAYLGPLRSYPERLYIASGAGRSTVGVRGEFTPLVLYHNSTTIDALNDWLGKFDIPYKLEIREVGGEDLAGKYITVALVDGRTETTVTLADVGFGINQLLPIIIEGVASSANAIICVEQPEIHLHPRLQAHLADLMVATSREKQWIVETHSELLIRRIQRRIRESVIEADDVSVIYVDPDCSEGEGSTIKVLALDNDGDFIDDWPHGFFEESYEELIASSEI